MNTAYAQGAINQYVNTVNHAAAHDADPHRLVAMLLEGARERLVRGRGHAETGARAERSQCLRSAMLIIDGLRMSLNREKGGEVAENLDMLYDYMTRRLLAANVRDDNEALEEVTRLVTEIEEAWREIGEQVRDN